jgi:aminoglycoside phosphotransferase (APT) family kinase protein
MAQSSAPQSGTEVGFLLARAFPRDRLLNVTPLVGGRSNAMFRARLSHAGDVVLRIFTRSAAEGRREVELLQRLRGRIVVPEVLASDAGGKTSAFVVYRYVEGTTFKEFKKTAGLQAIAEASFATGAALAEIGKQPPVETTPFRVEPDCPGWGTATWSGFLNACAGDPIFRQRAGTNTARAVRLLVERWSAQVADVSQRRGLIHGDFSRSNVVLHHASGTWRVAAILDWEFACGGSPLFDIGHFLRYESKQRDSLEPHFSDGFVSGGGVLPHDWHRLSRILDLAAIAGGLTKAHLPEPAQAELLKLLAATLRAYPSP